MDTVSVRRRSAIMARVRSQDTKPELRVRRLVHRLGYRYRLHRRDLPGAPDLVFPARRKVIFVHGCFWHQHRCPRGARQPANNSAYWLKKLEANQRRDRANRRRLAALGWGVLVLWECRLRDQGGVERCVQRFLG